MKREEILLLTVLGLLVSSKEALASNKLDSVRLATLKKDSNAWLISKVISLPLVEEETVSNSRATSITQSPQRTYAIEPGDTLEVIASLFQTTVTELASLNKIKNPERIWAGQTLRIPEPQSLTAGSMTQASKAITSQTANQNPNTSTPKPVSLKEIDVSALVEREKIVPLPPPDPPIKRKNFSTDVPRSNISPSPISRTQKAKQFPLEAGRLPLNPRSDKTFWERQPRQERTAPSRRELVFALPTSPEHQRTIFVPVTPERYLPNAPMTFTGYIWPTSGKLTSGYGWRTGRMHKGVDIANAIGTPIMAAASGEVIYAGWNSGGYGNLVKLKHANGSVTLYAHNSRVLVYEGQRVRQGELIAQMGSTGRSTGPHLHFEIFPNGLEAVDPIAYLPN